MYLSSPRITKIIATLGPKSDAHIRSFIEKGVDMFRLNFSHGSLKEHKERILKIREIEKTLNTSVQILVDLQGPKFRIGKLKEDTPLIEGNSFIFDKNEEEGDNKRVFLPHLELFDSLNPSDSILLNDGKIHLIVKTVDKNSVEAIVKRGGTLSSFKGINIPCSNLLIPSLTSQDKGHIQFSLEMGIRWIALSFVQTPEDITYVRNLLKNPVKIISKIEKPLALKNITSIVEQSDAIMIARGDLGIEIGIENLPAAQRTIINACHSGKKPVIMATHVMESMIKNPFPTRSEVSDLGNSINKGISAILFSAETAVGDYPLETINFASRVIESEEKIPDKIFTVPLFSF